MNHCNRRSLRYTPNEPEVTSYPHSTATFHQYQWQLANSWKVFNACGMDVVGFCASLQNQ